MYSRLYRHQAGQILSLQVSNARPSVVTFKISKRLWIDRNFSTPWKLDKTHQQQIEQRFTAFSNPRIFYCFESFQLCLEKYLRRITFIYNIIWGQWNTLWSVVKVTRYSQCSTSSREKNERNWNHNLRRNNYLESYVQNGSKKSLFHVVTFARWATFGHLMFSQVCGWLRVWKWSYLRENTGFLH